MKLVILDGNALNPGDLNWDQFKEFADITVYPRTPKELVAERIADSDIVFLNKVVIDEEILNKCPNLKYIGVMATGYNVVDLEAARKHNITVTNIPAYSTNAVAQHVFSFILHFTNHVALHNESVQNKDWINCPDFCYWKSPLQELSGKTLGIFGYGNIGAKVAEIGKAFGMNVICNTRTQKTGMPESVSFENLLKRSDFLTLHAPLTPQTKEIINKKSLSLMKNSAFLINTARGGFIVEQDLADALKEQKISGYAADVVTTEPMSKDSPLLGLKNCIITPHIAWAPFETRSRLMGIAYDNLKQWLNNTPQNVVN